MSGRPRHYDGPDPATRDLRERVAELEQEIGALRMENIHLTDRVRQLEQYERLHQTAARMGLKVGIVGTAEGRQLGPHGQVRK